ncbi:hypothetical protein SUNI508_04185 [Seiridium unicorne]|uniref:Uncharacterized protein n=1 Tax=Seiridium unicorne TaxID=138068 RepID=A0ABR2V957_9PEZI
MSLLVGPVTAVLMIPRILDWPIGGGVYWLYGSEARLFPTYLDSDYMADYPLGCRSAYNSLFDPKCPSAGYLSLQQHFNSWWNYPDSNMIEVDIQDFEMRKTLYAKTVDSQFQDTWAYTTHASTAMLLDAMRGLYASSLSYLQKSNPFDAPYPLNLGQAQAMRFEAETYVPAVRAACLTNWTTAITSESFQSQILMPFPVHDQAGLINRVSSSDLYSPTRYESVEVDTKDTVQQYLFNRSVINYENNNVTINSTFPQIIVIPIALPSQNFTELGLIIFEPTNATNNWATATCAIDSRWASASSIIESRDGDNMLMHEFTWDRVRNRVTTELKTQLTPVDNVQPNRDFPRTIRIDPSWYELLAPVLSNSDVYGDGYNGLEADRSTLERLLGILLFPSRGQWGGPSSSDPVGFGTLTSIRTIEHIISSVFADGLSRCGTHLSQQASKLLAGWKFGSWSIANETMARNFVHVGGPTEIFAMPAYPESNLTRREMVATFTGYVMAVQDGFDYFCVILLSMHAVIAISYTLWVLWKQEIIEAWDTIPEMLALAQTSPPPQDGSLENTCAGIRNLRTMGRIVSIERSSEGKDGCETEQLMLTFRNRIDRQDGCPQIEVETDYGSIITQEKEFLVV